MVDVFLQFSDSDGAADLIARRAVADLGDSQGVSRAWLVRRDAVEGERGIIEVLGALGVKLVAGPGVDAMLSFVRAALSRSGEREVVVKLPDGTEFALKGSDVSDEQFDRATSKLLSLLDRRLGGETA